ncbi:hypothetical protein KCU65_g9910, partial [Aureobasidium melanogenum]
MAPASDTTSSARRSNAPKIKEEWKRNVWRQKTATRLLAQDDQMIKLKSKEKRFSKVCSVHKALLCFYSPYHDRLLDGNFAEGLETPTKPLAINASMSVLKLFLTWLYTGKVDIAPPPHKNYDADYWYTGTAKLYIFADELNCVALQRTIMSELVKSCESAPFLADFETITLLSNSSLESSGLYQYYVETYDAHWNGTLKYELDDGLTAEDPMPPHLAFRLLLRKFKTPRDDHGEFSCCHDPCRYHGHENEEERKATCGAFDVEFEDDQEEGLNFESEPESEPESDPDIASDSTLRNKSAKKRSHGEEDIATSMAKRVKTT